MSMTQPDNRIAYARRGVERYREDVDDWKRRHDSLATHCWMWEDVVLKANLTFNIRQAKAILTPDDEYFCGDKLVSIRDEAIDAHRGYDGALPRS